jgi:acetyl-CoA synthetase
MKRNEIEGNQVVVVYALNIHGQIARTIWVISVIKKRILLPFQANFTGDGALRDEVGYYRITGRVDDVVIVSGHNLGTPIEDAIGASGSC